MLIIEKLERYIRKNEFSHSETIDVDKIILPWFSGKDRIIYYLEAWYVLRFSVHTPQFGIYTPQ